MKHEAIKRCPTAGSCNGKKCEKININSKITELAGEANDNPGFTYCRESCRCAGCGRWFCTYACLFYHTYAVPISNKIYEIFQCPTWGYKVKATVRITMENSVESHIFDLSLGASTEWKKTKLSLISLTTPPSPLLGSEFLSDGTKTMLIKASAEGQPVAGTVGSLQCANKNKAASFNCFMSKDNCNCQPQGDNVACQCTSGNLENMFNNIDRIIPLSTAGIAISGTGTDIEAEYNSVASMEIQVTLEELKLSTKISKNKCIVKPLSIGGCYNCRTGAKFKFHCKTDFNEAVAHIQCGMSLFSTICNARGVTASTILLYNKAYINEKCTVRCPAGTTNFNIEATLVFLEKEPLFNTSNMISGKTPNDDNFKNLDFGFLSSIFTGHWIISIIVIIIIIIIIIVTIPLTPMAVVYLSNQF